MEGEQRRTYILELLCGTDSPLSGSELAKQCGVSRQVIVQDIALLRATNKNILSTYKGYLIYQPEKDQNNVKRTYAVSHDDDRIRDELYTIVDYGGKVLDVIVNHEVYGPITVDLILNNRSDVDDFVFKLSAAPAKPLKELTGGNHFHTVEAASEKILDQIAAQLNQKGYLL
ncbi:MAG: transcription repressor NadR [Lachnospiraceae bacterium]|nr:transcription repressor NadR [Lachnospiraceae bacterium]